MDQNKNHLTSPLKWMDASAGAGNRNSNMRENAQNAEFVDAEFSGFSVTCSCLPSFFSYLENTGPGPARRYGPGRHESEQLWCVQWSWAFGWHSGNERKFLAHPWGTWRTGRRWTRSWAGIFWKICKNQIVPICGAPGNWKMLFGTKFDREIFEKFWKKRVSSQMQLVNKPMSEPDLFFIFFQPDKNFSAPGYPKEATHPDANLTRAAND